MTSVSRETGPYENLSPLLNYVAKQGPVNAWLTAWTKRRNKPPVLEGVHRALLPPLLILLSQQTERPVLCLTHDHRLADGLFEDFSWIDPVRVRLISPSLVPDENSLPTLDKLSPHEEQAFNLFFSGELTFLVIPLSPFRLMTVSTSPEPADAIRVAKGHRLTLSHLKDTFGVWGYDRVDAVFFPGAFAIRGGIIDVFPLNLPTPVRIELSGNTVHSLRFFDPLTQRMHDASQLNEVIIGAPRRLATITAGSPRPMSLPDDIAAVVIAESGPPDIYTLTTYSEDIPIEAETIDLACVSYRPFKLNRQAFIELVSYMIQKQHVKPFLLYDNLFVDRVKSDEVFEPFERVVCPLQGAFSSLALRLFCVSLDSVYDLPRPLPSAAPCKGKAVATPHMLPLPGDFAWGERVIHEDFGIGLYRGLKTVETAAGKHECVSVEFARGDMVHVPFHRLNRLYPYVGSGGHLPPLSVLGSTKWERTKQQTRRSAEEVVAEFIELYAVRHKAKGFRFSPDSEIHSALGQSFPYTETVDQLKAYDDIRTDMEGEKPMDRLLCGDVGFGKTEIAVRAALKAIYDKKQVAVLAPTTILASQHFVTFSARLSPFGVRVALLSRFTPGAQARKTKERLTRGHIDLVVGTHRLFTKDIKFRDLGLLIVDEEHRFGARHKEQLKKIRAEIDVLTMSATPIPRTLQFSLLRIRDVTTIMTPPEERLPVITRLIRYWEETITRATTLEIERRGQVFFVHDDVKTIGRVATDLETLFPSLSIGVAHGQLPGRALENTMINFLNKKIDILVCTTIIEAGIDLPNVNTIFINNAHRFGLSQIHQMRGRVGRSDRQAFCFLVVPSNRKLTPAALDRLRTIEYYSSLGAGYAIALKDLEMRGAGNLFGVEQSGHISSVGFHLYCKMVEEVANECLKDRPARPDRGPTEISFDQTAIIPPAFITDVADRLYFYRRLSTASHPDKIDDIRQEMRDRFGPLPLPADHLIRIAHIQVKARGSALKKLHISGPTIRGTFSESKEPGRFVSLGEHLRTQFSGLGHILDFTLGSTGALEFTITLNTKDPAGALAAAEYLFESIGDPYNFH